MRWEDERYVRLYTRDTTDWLGLSFDAQALFALLLRKVDRAGLLPLGKHGKRGVAIAIGHPREWGRLEPALEELLTDGCVRLTDDGATILVPNFIRAQEARASDKARQQKHRETAAAMAASQSVTPRDSASQDVTSSHAPSHANTWCNDASHDVTPSRAVPCLAVPSRAQKTTLSAPADPLQADDLPDATEDAQPLLVTASETHTATPEDLQALWNEVTAAPLPRWQGMSKPRRAAAIQRLRERPLAEWRRVFERVNASPFCRGENDRGWRADPEFILRPDSADKVLEGKYDRTSTSNSGTPRPENRRKETYDTNSVYEMFKRQQNGGA